MATDTVISTELAQRAYQVWEEDNKLLDELASRLGYEKITDVRIAVGTKVGMLDPQNKIIRSWERRIDGEWYCTDRSGYGNASLARVLPGNFVWNVAEKEVPIQRQEIKPSEIPPPDPVTTFTPSWSNETSRIAKRKRKPLTRSQKFNLAWALFWLIVWVAFLGPFGLIGWAVGGLIWWGILNGLKASKERAAIEAAKEYRVSSGLVTCPFCNQQVHPQKAESSSRQSEGSRIGWVGGKPAYLSGASSTSSHKFWKCSNCGMELGTRE